MELLLFALAALVLARTEELEPRSLHARNVSFFHHRGFHSSIVTGNYLYIDGGEITTWNGQGNGVQAENRQPEGNINTLPDNYTYSIDLTSSWTNSSVPLNQINKDAPVLNNEGLWLDASGDKFYAYDGGLSMSLFYWWETAPPNNALWQFEPSGDSGSWSQAPVSPSSNFSTLMRVTAANYAYGSGLGFALGGWENWVTSHDGFTADSTFVLNPGLVMYNSSSQEWFNLSSNGYSYYGYAVNGMAQFVPNFGEAGLLVTLGGYTTQTQLASLQYASIWDPMTQQWQSQTTSGDVPGETANGCIVGVEGDDGTYEIFLYGGAVGEDVQSTVSNGAVYVLSLPSFHWVKEPNPQNYGRWFHSCNVIGNRQMVVVGGVTAQPNDTADVFNVNGGSPDPWDQGIGIFDMTALEWKSSYDASAASYVTPDAIKSYISQNGKYPAQWASPVLEQWFKSSGSSASSGSSNSTSSTTGSNGPKATPGGVIAGAVVGGVLGLGLIGAGIFFLWGRRKREKAHEPGYAFARYGPESKPLSGDVAEAEGGGHQHEMDGAHGLSELAARDKPAEVPAGQVHELADQNYRYR